MGGTPTNFSWGGSPKIFTKSTCHVTHSDVIVSEGPPTLLRVHCLLRVRAFYHFAFEGSRLLTHALHCARLHTPRVAMATRYTALLSEIPPHTRTTHDSPYPLPPACSIDVSFFPAKTGTFLYYYRILYQGFYRIPICNRM